MLITHLSVNNNFTEYNSNKDVCQVFFDIYCDFQLFFPDKTFPPIATIIFFYIIGSFPGNVTPKLNISGKFLFCLFLPEFACILGNLKNFSRNRIYVYDPKYPFTENQR